MGRTGRLEEEEEQSRNKLGRAEDLMHTLKKTWAQMYHLRVALTFVKVATNVFDLKMLILLQV